MRIAAISNSRIPSATANSIQAMKVCDALVQCGHNVKMIVPAEVPHSSWNELGRHYGVQHEFQVQRQQSRPGLKRLDFLWNAHRSARAYHADLIYTWLPQMAAVVSRLGGPIVLEMHADVSGRMGAWWLRQFWKGRGGRLLVTTKALKLALERSTGMQFPIEAVQIAPNGVDLGRYVNLPSAGEARKVLKLAEGITVGFTGHFYQGRGIDLLYDLAKALPGINFLWVGGTAKAVAEWKARLQAARLRNVTLTGFVENSRLPLFQAASDILLMPYGYSVAASSGQEIAEVINPMKMFEYMAARRPIITADLPVIREILDDTRAVFCPAGDTVHWKAAIESLASDNVRRESLAESARREVAKYTWTARADRAIHGMYR